MKSYLINLMHLLIPANHIKSPSICFWNVICSTCWIWKVFFYIHELKIKVWRKLQSCNISQYLCRVSKLDQHVDIHMLMTNQWVLNCMPMEKCAKMQKSVFMLVVSNEYVKNSIISSLSYSISFHTSHIQVLLRFVGRPEFLMILFKIIFFMDNYNLWEIPRT